MQNRGKKYVSKKTITQNNIYMVWQFVYVHGVAVISISIGKTIRCNCTVFLSLKSQNNKPNPNLKTTIFLLCAPDSQ